MQNLSPLFRYQQILDEGQFQPDPIQHDAVSQLDRIWQQVIQISARPSSQGAHGVFTRLFRPAQRTRQEPVRGLYMWGGVGRGKTWIMDLFYQSLPAPRKMRLHFHRFMLRVHEELAALQGQSDPLEKVADSFKRDTDILCFDEFFVSDITDAMLLGGLMEALFARGITLVATSNIPPDELYRNGLQRARFLPAIAAIKQHCDVMNVDAGIDYRLRMLTQAHLWLTSAQGDTSARMWQMYQALTGETQGESVVLEINHRPLVAAGVANQVLAVQYTTLCAEPRSQHDYIALSRQYHTVLLFDVPTLSQDKEDEARRFIALIDEFYERHVKLIVSAQASLLEIYQGDALVFEFQRCLSRLQEMQSEAYLRTTHLP